MAGSPANGERLEVVVERAPLAESSLRAVAALYGQTDPKYASLEFLRHLSEANPSGKSTHLFARTSDGRAVGHYMTIPLTVTRAGDHRLCVKGEAFHVLEGYRNARSSDGIPLGIALLKIAFESAEAQGCDFIYAVTSKEVGALTRLNGCRELSVDSRVFTFLLRSGIHDGVPRGRREWLKLGLGIGQRLSRAAWRNLARVGRRTRTENAPVFHSDTTDLGQRWDLFWGPDQHHWMAEWLRAICLADQSECRVVVRKPFYHGDAVHILDWNVAPRALGPACYLMEATMRAAVEWGASRVVFSDHVTGANQSMFRAAKLTGFFGQESRQITYVRARDQYYLDPANSRLTPYSRAWF